MFLVSIGVVQGSSNHRRSAGLGQRTACLRRRCCGTMLMLQTSLGHHLAGLGVQLAAGLGMRKFEISDEGVSGL